MRTPAILFTSALGLLLLSGCKSHGPTCNQSNKDYVGAPELPPLKAPPGLEAPDTRNALRVPPLDTPERPRTKNEACLDAPPPFTNPKGPDAPPPK